MKIHITHIVGNRPHYMKLAPVYRALATTTAAEIEQSIINTGQHYTSSLSSEFLAELGLPDPDSDLNIKAETQPSFIGKAMVAIDESLQSLNPNIVIVYGDTNSTLAGTLAAAKSNRHVAHVEAGLREHDLSLPEEVNKRAIDAVSDLLFAPSESAKQQLIDEQSPGEIHFVGDVTYDLIHQLQSKIKDTFTQVKTKYNLPDKYILATCHRAINTDVKANLENILKALGNCGLRVILPIHPRTAQAITTHGLESYLEYDHISIVDPLPYLETQALLSHATYCITDSGGLIKEAYFHSVPAIIIDTQTEWVETVESGLHVVTGPQSGAILTALKQRPIPLTSTDVYGSGDACELIVTHLIDYISKHTKST